MGFIKRAVQGGEQPRNIPYATSPDASMFQDPNYQANRELSQRMAAEAKGQRPLNNQINFDAEEGFRGRQADLAGMLYDQARGSGPSLAQEQLNRGLEQNIESQFATAASQRGDVNTGSQQRMLAQNIARANQETVNQAGLQRLQEQQRAQELLGNVAAQARGQDISALQTKGSLLLSDQAARNDLVYKYTAMGMGLDAAQAQANRDLAAMQAQTSQFNAQLQAAAQQGYLNRQQQYDTGLIGAGASTAAAAAMLSDEQKKKDIKPANDDIKKMLDALSAEKYKYKEPSVEGAAPGKRYGIMAQDLEKSKPGASVVMDSEGGKKIDANQSIGLIFAALANLNERLNKKGK